jgi:hypothetical protein
MFLQEHGPGMLGISDLTLLKGDPITISGEVIEHRLFHVRLPYSGWCHLEVIHGGESFVALAEALQNAREAGDRAAAPATTWWKCWLGVGRYSVTKAMGTNSSPKAQAALRVNHT